MSNIIKYLSIIILTTSLSTASTISESKWVNPVSENIQLKSVIENDQLIIVTTKGYGQANARIQTFEWDGAGWTSILDLNGYIGAEGFSNELLLEGKSQTPVGKYSIGTAFGRAYNPGTALPYREIVDDDVWVDDPESSLYNTWQKNSENNGRWSSAEKMNVSAYNYGLVINYNTEIIMPYAGSAFFLHISEKPTAGCIGISRENVISILKWLDPSKNPCIIMCPSSELGNY